MKAVQVTYQVREEYIEENKANIRKVMSKLRAEPIEGMMYSTYTTGDGSNFVHINIAKNQELIDKLNELEEFNSFRMALKASSPIKPPTSIALNLVDAGFEL
mgnify:CR=1 FL=1